jgi:hypothetical protein
MVERGRPHMTIWRMRIACWVPKATNTQSEYVTPIVFPLQQLLYEHTSVLRYTPIALLFCIWYQIHVSQAHIPREMSNLHKSLSEVAAGRLNLHRPMAFRQLAVRDGSASAYNTYPRICLVESYSGTWRCS